jgi:putative oxidoreductase
VLIAAVLIYSVVTHLAKGTRSAAPLELLEAGLSIFVLVGLWTPIVGTLTSVTEIWVLLSRTGDSWIPIIVATLSATLAMIGPGAWSVDARLFGRKHITSTEVMGSLSDHLC